MPREYDAEDLCVDLEKLLKAKLNDAIASVEAEAIAKGHGASDLAPIPDDCYHRYGWTDSVLNTDLALLTSFNVAGSEDLGGALGVTYSVEVTICISGGQNDSTANQKALRYAKALKRTFKENFGRICPGKVREKIETMGPADFKIDGKSNARFKAVGVALTVVLG